MIAHLKKFVSFLEGLLGKKMDWDRLEEIVDLRLFDEEEALSKAEAFAETMDHFREEREKAGMAW